MQGFLAELGRRNVFRVGAVYAGVSWQAIQVGVTVLPTFIYAQDEGWLE